MRGFSVDLSQQRIAATVEERARKTHWTFSDEVQALEAGTEAEIEFVRQLPGAWKSLGSEATPAVAAGRTPEAGFV